MDRSIYEFPDIFRRVHMERPGEIEAEAAFCRRSGGAIASAGPARAGYRRAEFAARPIFARGIAAVGVDDSPTMICGRTRRIALASTPILRFYRRNSSASNCPSAPSTPPSLCARPFR